MEYEWSEKLTKSTIFLRFHPFSPHPRNSHLFRIITCLGSGIQKKAFILWVLLSGGFYPNQYSMYSKMMIMCFFPWISSMKSRMFHTRDVDTWDQNYKLIFRVRSWNYWLFVLQDSSWFDGLLKNCHCLDSLNLFLLTLYRFNPGRASRACRWSGI